MRLGTLIAALENCNSNAPVRLKAITPDEDHIGEYPGGFDSYRGYYERLALDPDGTPCTVGELLERAKAANGAVFTGWKGGEFLMTPRTLVHLARRGETTDNRIVGVEYDEHAGDVYLLIAHVEDW